MRCFVNRVVTDRTIESDVKMLIPDAALRRRMSRVVRLAVATAVECVGGSDGIAMLDGIITATGLGCLTDSERFLRNMIADNEQLLNPTPFIQSTFNTVGGQIAMLGHNRCYNVTYVNRSHSFEDALLDASMRLSDGQGSRLLVGAFDEQTPSQLRIMERMGMFRRCSAGEGVVFVLLSCEQTDDTIAELSCIDFPSDDFSVDKIREYASSDNAVIISDSCRKYGVWPTLSAMSFADGIDEITNGAEEVIIYNEYMGGGPTVMVLRCVG